MLAQPAKAVDKSIGARDWNWTHGNVFVHQGEYRRRLHDQ